MSGVLILCHMIYPTSEEALAKFEAGLTTESQGLTSQSPELLNLSYLGLYNKCPADCFLQMLWQVAIRSLTSGKTNFKGGLLRRKTTDVGGTVTPGWSWEQAWFQEERRGSRCPWDVQDSRVELGTCLALPTTPSCWGTKGCGWSAVGGHHTLRSASFLKK